MSEGNEIKKELADIKTLLKSEGNETKKELANVKTLLKKVDRRAKVQWIFGIGLAVMLGSMGLWALDINSWGAIPLFLLGIGLLIAAPKLSKKL